MIDLNKILSDQKKLQQYFDYPIDSDDDTVKVSLLREYLLAMLDEVHEALHEFSWKKWSNDLFINDEQMLSELVDVFMFLSNAMLVIGADEDAFMAKYEKKKAVNIDRALSGYSQTKLKCKYCGRALDDFYSKSIIFHNDIVICPICEKEEESK